MLDVVVKTLGVLGFLIACASLGWQIWTYRDTRKEKVSASLWFGARIDIPGPALFAQIWNSGRVPVYLEKVEVAWGDEARTGVCSLPLTPNPHLSGPLEVGQGHEFVLVASPLGHFIKKASEQSQNKVWFSVHVPGGEILRLDGRAVRPLLISLAQQIDVATTEDPQHSGNVEPGG